MNVQRYNCYIFIHHPQSNETYFTYIYLPYILMYKLRIFGWILTTKLWESAYMQVMPHNHSQHGMNH